MSKIKMSELGKSRSGLSFPSALTLLFIGLKLTGSVDWSWLWVLSPSWIAFLLFFIIGFLMGMMGLIDLKN